MLLEELDVCLIAGICMEHYPLQLWCCVLRARMGGLLEDGEQRDHGERCDHQQFVVVDVGDDLRLLRNHGVERRPPSFAGGIPELCDGRSFEHAVDDGDVLNDFGMLACVF